MRKSGLRRKQQPGTRYQERDRHRIESFQCSHWNRWSPGTSRKPARQAASLDWQVPRSRPRRDDLSRGSLGRANRKSIARLDGCALVRKSRLACLHCQRGMELWTAKIESLSTSRQARGRVGNRLGAVVVIAVRRLSRTCPFRGNPVGVRKKMRRSPLPSFNVERCGMAMPAALPC